MSRDAADKSPLRADALMVKRGLAASRERAQAMIADGQVMVGGAKLAKASRRLLPQAEISVTTPDIPWVSRGALKLVGGFDSFPALIRVACFALISGRALADSPKFCWIAVRRMLSPSMSVTVSFIRNWQRIRGWSHAKG